MTRPRVHRVGAAALAMIGLAGPLSAGCARARFRPMPPPAAAMAPPAAAIPLSAMPASTDRLALGESLRYTIFWLGLAVLQGAAEVSPEPVRQGGRAGVAATATVRSTGLVRRLFAVDDRVAAVTDPATLLPLQFQFALLHRARRNVETVTFDHARGQALSTTAAATTPLTISPTARDLVSAFYFLRTTALVEGHRVTDELVLNGRLWPFTATVHRRGLLTIPQGTFAAFEMEVRSPWLAQYVHQEALWLWLTTDPTHTPLMARVKVPFLGTLTAFLDDRAPAWPPRLPEPPAR